MKVWISTSEYRGTPRWDEEGSANLETFIDGVSANEKIAKAYALWCSDKPIRWHKANTYGEWIGAHRHEGEGAHFHVVRSYEVADHVNDWGQPLTKGRR